MSVLHRGNQRILPGKLAFKLWFELGTLEKAAKAMEEQGYKNKNTGLPFSAQGIYNSAVIWVCENHEEARPYYIKAGSTIAEDDQLWEEFLVQTYATRYRNQRNWFVNWARANGFYRKHFHLFADYFGISDPDEFDKEL